MKIDILTIFPKMFKGPFKESLIKRAKVKGLVEIKIHDLRKWTKDKHKTVDDRPYGGGPGMILMAQPIFDAVESLKSKIKYQKSKISFGKLRIPSEVEGHIKNQKLKQKVILLTPQGKVFRQSLAKKLSKFDHLILICGHYEGVDERIRKYLVDEEISIGDYVLTGGELPAMVLVDTIVRLIPGVVGKEQSLKEESFAQENLLEYPQYTRPENYQGWKVPGVLLSGNHKEIEKWRKNKALERTKKCRPDLLK